MIAVFSFIFVNAFECEQMPCYMSLGYFTSGQLWKQKKNKVGEMKKRTNKNASCICCQGEREGGGMISCFNCWFESPFK